MLKYKEHANDCWTERVQFFHNDREGDLVYDSTEGTTVERTDEGLRIKVQLPKCLNWLELADMLSCEVRVLSHWAHEKHRKKIEIADLEVIERDPEFEKRRDEMFYTDQDPFLFLYFYDEKSWVMYENDEDYLFVFDLANDNNYMLAEGMDGLFYTPHDCLCGVYSWLQRWYYRVNGDDAEDCDD